jgi:predicted transposase/invertase (TIGR01784 family)
MYETDRISDLLTAEEKGEIRGMEKGQEQKAKAIAKNLLAKGSPPEFIQEVTGLDMQTIKELAAK